MTRHPRERAERGSISTFYLSAAVGMALVVGLAVDLGGSVYAQQRAFDVAGQAARAGGQAVLAAPAVRGQPVQLDHGRARAAALAYLAGAGMTGTVTVTDTSIEVHTSHRWTPLVLGEFGIGAREVTGTASARLARVVDGTER